MASGTWPGLARRMPGLPLPLPLSLPMPFVVVFPFALATARAEAGRFMAKDCQDAEWGPGACTCALLTHLTIVEQVKCEYDRNKQCATISPHVDISIVNERNFTHEYLMPMQIIHKHKLFSVTSYIIASALCALHGIHDWSQKQFCATLTFQSAHFMYISMSIVAQVRPWLY